MLQTFEAFVDPHGAIRLLEPVELSGSRRVLVIVLDEAPMRSISETALLSEAALAKDWNRPEEDAAWSHLQSVK